MDGSFPKWANVILLLASLIIAFHFLKASGIG
jgi:hypothetical protein